MSLTTFYQTQNFIEKLKIESNIKFYNLLSFKDDKDEVSGIKFDCYLRVQSLHMMDQ